MHCYFGVHMTAVIPLSRHLQFLLRTHKHFPFIDPIKSSSRFVFFFCWGVTSLGANNRCFAKRYFFIADPSYWSYPSYKKLVLFFTIPLYCRTQPSNRCPCKILKNFLVKSFVPQIIFVIYDAFEVAPRC
ncbi:MAG: hypothetical protein CM15mV103_180 [uncultured marine virus]|nr:MAG: hypothetical protein CM15mV103_180 [uncultured marine virus]